ncbi:MAG: tetratricopeptide repeat protein [Massilia sp.]
MQSTSSTALTALLQQAVALHQQGRLHDAQTLYARVLASDPRQFDALHLSGVIARQLGQPFVAVDLITRAIAINPSPAPAHCNLGAALQDIGRTEEALTSYETAVRLDPRYALAFNNLGNTLRKLGRMDEAMRAYERALALRPAYPEALCHKAILFNDLGRAEDALDAAERALALRERYPEALCARANAQQALGRYADAVDCYERAIAITPTNAEAWCWRGTALARLHEFDEALSSYEHAIAIKPGYASAHHFRANTLRSLSRPEDAIVAYRSALALGADATQIAFALAALGVGEAPDNSPASYVKTLFDNYAGHFDQHLTQVLDYQMPAFLAAAIGRHAPAQGLATLDLGCGTGLCGPYLRACSSSLTGVDLSQKMLDKARERGVYDELACAEITDFLDGRENAWDLVVAADVFVYFGDLAPAFGAVHRALRTGGHFCFSVEAGEVADFTLTTTSRYAHSRAYLERLARDTGLLIAETEKAPSRTENGERVDAFVMVLRRP